jgi:hypothetical protein
MLVHSVSAGGVGLRCNQAGAWQWSNDTRPRCLFREVSSVCHTLPEVMHSSCICSTVLIQSTETQFRYCKSTCNRPMFLTITYQFIHKKHNASQYLMWNSKNLNTNTMPFVDDYIFLARSEDDLQYWECILNNAVAEFSMEGTNEETGL